MEDRRRTTKLFIVADESGRVLSAMWPGARTEGAPTETGTRLAADQRGVEVDVPKDFYRLVNPDLGAYRVRETDSGLALTREPAEEGGHRA